MYSICILLMRFVRVMIKRFFFRAVIVVVESLVFWGGTSGISNLRQDRSIDSRSKISYVGNMSRIFLYW